MIKTGIYEYRYTQSGRKLKLEKMICSCGKEFFKRTDVKSLSNSCGCLQLEAIKKNFILGKEYKNIIPIKEIERWESKTGKTKRRQFLCLCKKCNNEFTILAERIGKQNNCGCSINITHNMSRTKIYQVYAGIIARCNNEKNHAYKNYGGRGIMCKWKTFEDFYKDMGESYDEELEIDRIDNNGDYCKENCRWVTAKENTRNRRTTIMYKGKPLAEVCELHNMRYNLVYKRVKELGWSIEKALGIGLT